ncbi:MAG TPA: type II secretion system protein [Verrucomicrobiae bacterium]|nr:type II secretion system protein [Verrucomicrobiae bacterium]
MRNRIRTDPAFTLIEMLAVIGIIAVLVALLFPAIKSSLTKSEITQAQSGVANLTTAFKAYYTEYGKWPISDTLPNWNYVVDGNMVSLLSGADIGPSTTPLPVPTTETDGIIGSTSGAYQGNPHRVAFLQFKQADLGNGNGGKCTGCFLDPWKKAYYVRFDVTYVGTIPNPFSLTAVPITNGVIVWSDGPDGLEYHDCGDPPGPYKNEPPPCVNRDNVKSW